MARDPADRYQTGRELAEAAARALGVRRIRRPRYPVSPERVRGRMIEIAAQTSALRRKPLVLGLGAAAVILIGVLIGALAAESRTIRRRVRRVTGYTG